MARKLSSMAFSDHAVRSIIAGRKTRHIFPLSPQPESKWIAGFGIGRPGYPDEWTPARVPYGFSGELSDIDWRKWQSVATRPFNPGDKLWVKEPWAVDFAGQENRTILYRSDNHWPDNYYVGPWSRSSHMRKEDSRITLTVLNVGIQRVQTVSEQNALEADVDAVTLSGTESLKYISGSSGEISDTAADAMRLFWNSQHRDGIHNWEYNPRVVSFEFEVFIDKSRASSKRNAPS